MDNQFINFVSSMKTTNNASLLESAIAGYRVIYENSDAMDGVSSDFSTTQNNSEPTLTVTISGERAKSILPVILSIDSVAAALDNTTFAAEWLDEIEIICGVCDIEGEGYHRGSAAQWNVSPDEPAGFDAVTFELENFSIDVRWRYVADGETAPDFENSLTENIEPGDMPDELYATIKSIAQNDSSLIDTVYEIAMDGVNDYDDRDYDDRDYERYYP